MREDPELAPGAILYRVVGEDYEIGKLEEAEVLEVRFMPAYTRRDKSYLSLRIHIRGKRDSESGLWSGWEKTPAAAWKARRRELLAESNRRLTRALSAMEFYKSSLQYLANFDAKFPEYRPKQRRSKETT